MEELNLTPMQAITVIVISLVVLYLILTTKATEQPTEMVEAKNDKNLSPVYLERYGAYIQAQQYN